MDGEVMNLRPVRRVRLRSGRRGENEMARRESEGNLNCDHVMKVHTVLKKVTKDLRVCLDNLPHALQAPAKMEKCSHEDYLKAEYEEVKDLIRKLEKMTDSHVRPTSRGDRDSGVGSTSEDQLQQEKRKGQLLSCEDVNMNRLSEPNKIDYKRLNVPNVEDPSPLSLQDIFQTAVKILDDASESSTDSIEDNTKADSPQ